MRETKNLRCLLCGRSMPAHEVEAQWEHMCFHHQGCTIEEAKSMVKDNFVSAEEKKE